MARCKALQQQVRTWPKVRAWQKMRVTKGQEFVIAGYTPSPKNFDALVIGYYEGSKLIYAARTRNGFTPASRAELFKKLKPLEISTCPFANLPEKKAGRWGAGLTAAKMAACRWLRPQFVGQFEFVEWTEDAHLEAQPLPCAQGRQELEGREAGKISSQLEAAPQPSLDEAGEFCRRLEPWDGSESSLNAEVNAFDRLQIVRGLNSSKRGSK